ncbi:Transcription-repair-coupling factor [compost metagenome]
MKVCLYAVRFEKGWQLRVSLDIRVDLRWLMMTGIGGEVGRDKGMMKNGSSEAIFVWLLSEAMPLGWAVTLRDYFKECPEMDNWRSEEWGNYLRRELKHELEEEERARGAGSEFTYGNRIKRQRIRWESLAGSSPCIIWEREAGLTPQGEFLFKQDVDSKQASGYLDMDEDNGGSKISNNTPTLTDKKSDMYSANMWLSVAIGSERLSGALAGRSLLQAELQQLLAERLPELAPAWRSAVQHAHLEGRVQLTAGVALAAGRRGRGPLAARARLYRCRRCGSEVHRRTPCGACGLSGCAYCEACLALGRSRSCALLLRGSAGPVAPLAGGAAAGAQPFTESMLDRWGLSPAQRAAAASALCFLAARPQDRAIQHAFPPLSPRSCSLQINPSPQRFLLWAVTGAGKTEMIFPLLQYVLDRGGRALVATPRRDVVLELAPRIAKAFPEEKIAVLYGGSTQRWEEADLFLATTHQLLRFYRAFDLVIIDELDAFPYHNDPMLAFAARECCAASGKFVFLSATPPLTMQKEVKSGKLPHAKVPSRFHGYPLPVPRHISMTKLDDCIRRQALPKGLIEALDKSIQRGAQVFLFVSRIRHIEPAVKLLRRYFSKISIEGTSSKDEHRGEKVIRFRSTEIRILVTTTILERGVTVPKSDVYILDADSELFDEASLVQMAGRAGRSKDDPCGTVWLASPEWTKPQRRAIAQIRSMNAIAEKHGYLKIPSSKLPGKEVSCK